MLLFGAPAKIETFRILLHTCVYMNRTLYILYFVFYDYSRQLLNSLDHLNITVLYRILFYAICLDYRSMSTNSRSIAAEALEKLHLKYERSCSAWLFNPEYFLHNLLALIHCTGCIKNIHEDSLCFQAQKILGPCEFKIASACISA